MKTTEEPFEYRGLSKLGPAYKVYLVQNSPRGILLDDEDLTKCSWVDLGYTGDGRRNRFAIEVRARNGRVVAAVAWWICDERDGAVSTLGTYVSKKLRRQGLASALWRAMIQVTGAKKVFSEPRTSEGLTLVESLRDKIKDLEIEYIDNEDLLFLEDLRSRKRKIT